MKKALYAVIVLFLSVLAFPALAQEGTTTYQVLKLPASAHAAALGGENISAIDDSPAAGWSNPALFANVSDKSLGLDFMTFNSGSLYLGAQYVQAFGERHTVAAGLSILNYGKMDETDETGQRIGSFSPKDMMLSLAYSYLLSERWTGGASLHFINRNYAGYTSFAMGVDLGLNYFNEETDFSFSIALRNIGMEVKSFYETSRDKLPFDMQLGLTKGLAHFPARLNFTLTDLTHWKSSDFYLPPGKTSLSATQKLLNHVVVGVDILPTDNTYIALGYNFRRGYELKVGDAQKMAGFTLGAGLQLQRFKFGASYAKYRVGAGSLLFNVAYTL
ncbi:type IX secretion system protein PorQ [Alloprevotella tannerae]|jgi:hypothetical protein|uniref:type IX secretion system protein PorQ n=1 Tax=Alloprevotella tannerae TaxID=76122 RepID=UPI001EDB8BDC|nr:type IX secretion system protein PorQ [Alloprevotella tannerae]MCG2647369.1 type IX secretion system protein PorQ [Alloprevotella tannerae]